MLIEKVATALAIPALVLALMLPDAPRPFQT